MFASREGTWDAGLHLSAGIRLVGPLSAVRDDRVPPLEGEPDQVVIDDAMITFFSLDPNVARADAAGHFRSCHWVIAESKSRGHIAKALEQLKSTYAQAKSNGFDIHYVAVIYETLGSEKRLFTVRERTGGMNVLWNKRVGLGGPVTIDGKEVIALKRDAIARLYKQSRIQEER